MTADKTSKKFFSVAMFSRDVRTRVSITHICKQAHAFAGVHTVT